MISLQVYSKGKRVMGKCITRSPSLSHMFDIEVNDTTAQSMAPTSKLIVWYITETGDSPELIADATLISIGAADVFANKVSSLPPANCSI